MAETLEDYIRDFISSLQLAKIYPLEHPQFNESLHKAYTSLQHLLSKKSELALGIVGEELAVEREILFDLSKTIKPLIHYLKERGVERVIVRRGVTREELAGFIAFLITPKDTMGSDTQKYLATKGIKNIVVGKLGVSPLDDKIGETVNYLSQYQDSVEKVTHTLNSLLNNETLNYIDLKYTFTMVLENILTDKTGFLKLATIKKHDITIFIHLIDVAILTMYVTYKMGFKSEDVMDMGIAALFHDMGKIYISRKIIEKPDKLNDEEFTLMKSHTVYGALILLKYTMTLGTLPAVVAFEHHLRYDMKGYPKLAFAQSPHIVSLIVSLCDVYDALNQRRSYKRSYSPDAIYNLMQKEKGGAFSPELLDALFEIVGVWPIGTIVRLSDQRVAIVKEVNKDDIFSPKVEIVALDNRKECVDLREKKEELKIECALDPQGEGKQYARLSYM